MEKVNRTAQLYGYVVCLIALVVSLVCVASIVSAVFDRANPLHA